MIPYLRLVVILLLLSAGTAHAQLREFDITPISPSGPIPVFRDHPDKVAVILRSSLTNLRFDSNLGVTADLSDASRGEYVLILDPVRQSVTVNAPGYQQSRIQITLTEARQVAYYRVEPKPEVVLNLIPTNIQITPADAIVSIDGNRVDISKPVPIEVGTHMIRIEKQGFRTIEKEVRISADQNLIRETLSAIEVVPMTIKTQPTGATILIDGVQAGVTDRNGDLGLFRFPGTYELAIQLSGYLPETRTITVSETGSNAFSSTLIRNAGTLRLSVSPSDAAVLLNRQPVNASQPIELAPGLVQIEVSKANHEPFSESIEIFRGQTASRTISLEAHVGGIQITTTPLQSTWSLTTADGKVVASGTGLARKTGIPVGSYTLLIKADDHQDHTGIVAINRDQVLEKNVELMVGPPPCSTLRDIDGNTYKAVQIGDQCWIAENLRTTKYQDGSSIPNVKNNSQWGNLSTGAWSHYDNQVANDSKYGKLYNWYAVADSRNICPVGWHVPRDAEGTVLSDYLGENPGFKMKSTSGWNNNGNGSNSSGFSGYPGGHSNNLGNFFVIERNAYFWSSTESSSSNAWYRPLGSNNQELYRSFTIKLDGFSVRCIRD
jgi:uncharacterized protein (TIGR02145 family)